MTKLEKLARLIWAELDHDRDAREAWKRNKHRQITFAHILCAIERRGIEYELVACGGISENKPIPYEGISNITSGFIFLFTPPLKAVFLKVIDDGREVTLDEQDAEEIEKLFSIFQSQR